MTAKLTRRSVIKTIGLGVCSTALTPLNLHAATSAAPIELVAKPGESPITSGQTGATAIWGYNGQVPGPTLRVVQGDTLKVRLHNELQQPTSIHWHGIRIVNAMDGSPLVQKPVATDASFDYEFSLPDAGTYWYHTHTRGYEQLTRGLYGGLIVEEKNPLPEVYDDDQLLIFDDWMLDDDGQIEQDNIGHMMFLSHGGRIGNWGSVNGVNKPELAVTPGARMRARLINVCNARVLELVFGELAPWLIALDGQPTVPQLIKDSLVLAPGQRADLAIDIPATPNARLPLGVVVGDQVYPAATLVSQSTEAIKPRDAAPVALPGNNLPEPDLTAGKTAMVTLDMTGGAMGGMQEAKYGGELMDIKALIELRRVWAFNGMTDMDKSATPLFDVERGTSVSIDISNNTNWSHAMHLHGHHFRVVAKQGKSIPPEPWRDTHLMQPGERHTIALMADNPGDWLIHCHMVEHSVAGMTGWFRVS